MRLLAIHTITARIRLRSGLHIGAGNDTVEIGGLAQPIIKNPLTGAPYIPGSSLKGKMRSLLETTVFMDRPSTRAAVLRGTPCDCGQRDCPVCTLFGAHKAPQQCAPDLGPTRLLVRDAYLTDEWAEEFSSGRLPMEIKNENTIDRVKGTAANPRSLERVPVGVCFALTLSLKRYEGDAEQPERWIWKGLKLLEMDALGGNGSRGSGQVVFEEIMLDGAPVELSAVTAF